MDFDVGLSNVTESVDHVINIWLKKVYKIEYLFTWKRLNTLSAGDQKQESLYPKFLSYFTSNFILDTNRRIGLMVECLPMGKETGVHS